MLNVSFQGSALPHSHEQNQKGTGNSFATPNDVTQAHLLREILQELRQQRHAPEDDVTTSEIVREWQLVAMVLDRVFLVVFVFAFLLTTLLILLGGQN